MYPCRTLPLAGCPGSGTSSSESLWARSPAHFLPSMAFVMRSFASCLCWRSCFCSQVLFSSNLALSSSRCSRLRFFLSSSPSRFDFSPLRSGSPSPSTILNTAFGSCSGGMGCSPWRFGVELYQFRIPTESCFGLEDLGRVAARPRRQRDVFPSRVSPLPNRH